jgi:hypothetical protein
MPDNGPIYVEPVADEAAQPWPVVRGQELLDFLQSSVPEAARDNISEAAVSIIGKGVPPTQEVGQETGLVVGYVQSGKTMSFEAVIALARDNGFPIVIVVTGSSRLLLGQSTGRLRQDLRLDDPRRERRWLPFLNPGDDDSTVQPIRDVLAEWRDPGTPEEFKRTALITVLKHHQRLQNLTNLVSVLDIRGLPVLLIDDEADQISLNTQVTQGRTSTTYRRLMALRQALPKHTYLQYTATPQAPLLISIIDSLSPNFVYVLEPGVEYTGGQAFFGDNQPNVRVIPPQEVPTRNSPLNEPPDTLLEALRVFMVGVAAGFRESRNVGNRSMLVHPSVQTAPHQEFYGWVRDIFEEWKRRLDLPDNDPDKLEFLEELQDAHADLLQTVGPTLPTFDELRPYLRLAFLNTRVMEVNAREGATPEIDWRSMYGWILVGGQAMDRGFTVEGLTVTYMPRGLGTGNADTVQQRARFFGYKRRYLGYCRIYLEQGSLNAFQSYVTHEEDMRSQLQRFQESGQPLNDWKRAFLLDGALRPCRNSVLEFDYIRGRFSDDWVNPRIVLATDAVYEANRQTVAEFVRGLDFVDDDGHPDRTDIQRHLICENVPLLRVVEELLVNMRITGTTDSQRNTGLLLQISKALEANPNEVCSIYRMSGGRRRERGVDEDGDVLNLYQGEAPVQPRDQRGTVYPGDRRIRDHDNISVQIHSLNLTREGVVVAENVPVLAVWVPARLARAWIAQEPQVQP